MFNSFCVSWLPVLGELPDQAWAPPISVPRPRGVEPSGWGLPLSLKGWSSLAVEGWDQKAGASPIWPRPSPVSSRWGGGLKEGLIPEASSRVLLLALNSSWESSAPPPRPAPLGRLPPPLSSGIPSPKSLWGCGRRRCEPRLGGVSSPSSLHERGAGSCPPPGHEPVPAAPGTVAGTPGRLPRPPAHTHPRALARCGPFRLPGPPNAPPPTACREPPPQFSAPLGRP